MTASVGPGVATSLRLVPTGKAVNVTTRLVSPRRAAERGHVAAGCQPAGAEAGWQPAATCPRRGETGSPLQPTAPAESRFRERTFPAGNAQVVLPLVPMDEFKDACPVRRACRTRRPRPAQPAHPATPPDRRPTRKEELEWPRICAFIRYPAKQKRKPPCRRSTSGSGISCR